MSAHSGQGRRARDRDLHAQSWGKARLISFLNLP
jgi:hypothetical protein